MLTCTQDNESFKQAVGREEDEISYFVCAGAIILDLYHERTSSCHTKGDPRHGRPAMGASSRVFVDYCPHAEIQELLGLEAKTRESEYCSWILLDRSPETATS